MLKLFIGNKNYSSWSMRAGVLIKQADIACEEVVVRFDSFAAGSNFRQIIDAISPTGKVPVLVDTDVVHGLVVWDTLAIAEYLAEKFPEKGFVAARLWRHGRRLAACVPKCIPVLRACAPTVPMNIEASLRETGQLVWRDQPAVRADVETDRSHVE
jgi:glutathione S-transferase